MIEYTSDDQRDFVEQIVVEAVQMTKPLPDDLAHRDTVHGRLNILVAGILCDLEGYGCTEQFRLSVKGKPDIDLVDAGLRDQWLRRIEDDDPAVRGFLTTLLAAYVGASRGHDLARACGGFLVGLAELIEGGYEMAAQLTDDDGKWIGEGPDIAPGLAAAVRAAWAARDAIAA
ncbi:hypothetical protein [Micromonospora chalcea]|uniref:hypothetical protein n=1 Tax=Micromonospora chalcea TaxID=1874 RepID=UPI003D726D68